LILKQIQFHILFFALALFVPAGRMSAQWVQLNGPEGGDIYTFYDGGTYLLAGGVGGVFRSTDNGISWSKSNDGMFLDLTVYSLTKQGQYIFAGTMFYGVYRSDDDGVT
jgi:hypothetical protein